MKTPARCRLAELRAGAAPPRAGAQLSGHLLGRPAVCRGGRRELSEPPRPDLGVVAAGGRLSRAMTADFPEEAEQRRQQEMEERRMDCSGAGIV